MSTILIIIVLLILFGGGGGYYGHGRWYGPGVGFSPYGIIWIIVIVLLIVWLVNELGVIRIR